MCLLSTFQISEGGLQDPRASDTLYFVLVRSATFFRFGESWRQLKVYRMWARPQVINICMLYRPYDKNQFELVAFDELQEVEFGCGHRTGDALQKVCGCGRREIRERERAREKE